MMTGRKKSETVKRLKIIYIFYKQGFVYEKLKLILQILMSFLKRGSYFEFCHFHRKVTLPLSVHNK